MLTPFERSRFERNDRATARLRRLLDPRHGVRLPPGVKVSGVDFQSAKLKSPDWRVPWRGDGRLSDPDDVELLDDEIAWPVTLVDAAADPEFPERALARLVISEIAAAAAQAVCHEFIEWAAVDNVELWDAHPGAGATATDEMIKAFTTSSPQPQEINP